MKLLGILISGCLQVKDSNQKLLGIACSDVSEDDLFTDVTYFHQGELSYAFLVDNTGRVAAHPLFPRPNNIGEHPVFLNMQDLERFKEAKEIFESMSR